MTPTETARLLAYINALDNQFIADDVKTAAWGRFLPATMTLHDALQAVDSHYKDSTRMIKPKDVLERAPEKPLFADYKYGKKPVCGNCDDGYISIPQPPTAHGHIYNHVTLCNCQWSPL